MTRSGNKSSERRAGNVLSHGSLVSVFDQGVVSLSNFATTILLARALSAHDFGIYILLSTAILIANGLIFAFINEPIRVFAIDQSSDHFAEYASAQYLIRLFAAILSTATACAVLAYAFDVDSTVLASVGAVMFTTQTHEFVRALNSSRKRWTNLLFCDATAHGARLFCLCGLFASEAISIERGLLSVALGSFLGSITFTFAGAAFTRAGWNSIRAVMRKNWAFGKWIVLESFVFVVSTQLYLYLVALWVDVPAAGALGAAQTAANALNVLLIGATSYATPVAREYLMAVGYDAWKKFLIRAGSIAVLVASALAAIISVFAEAIMTTFFSSEFVSYSSLLVICAITVVVSVANSFASIAFRTADKAKAGFVARTASAGAALIVAYPLISVFGVIGAAAGGLVSQIIWLVVYVLQMRYTTALDRVRLETVRAASGRLK